MDLIWANVISTINNGILNDVITVIGALVSIKLILVGYKYISRALIGCDYGYDYDRSEEEEIDYYRGYTDKDNYRDLKKAGYHDDDIR